MPQNPLDILNKMLPKPVGGTPRDPAQQQAWDADAALKQAQDPLWKRAGRGVFDALTSAVAGDPLAEGSDKASLGSKLGMLAAAAPFSTGELKSLPMIAPEAYSDVKAGGLRLYSRLTDTFAKAPKQLVPGKIRSLAAQGASAEEVGLRKLEEFLQGRPEMAKIPREEVMQHLAANPLELNVVKRGAPKGFDHAKANTTHDQWQLARTELDQHAHNMETKYGANYDPDEHLTDAEFEHYRNLVNREEELHQANIASQQEYSDMADTNLAPRYDWMQTPGPKENYGETLINLPPKTKVTPENYHDIYRKRYASQYDDFTPDEHQIRDLQDAINKDDTYTSPHWDEPNNLVHVRHNDRRLNPTNVTEKVSYGNGPDGADYGDFRDASTAEGGSKGRFIEEIQSDWHQQGREQGYKSDPMPEINVSPLGGNGDYMAETPAGPEYQYAINAIDGAHARRNLEDSIMEQRVPDAPFKDTYHELALKQQLLDAADQPDLDWLGVADADTVAALEGHSEVKPGMELNYNQKHPSALEKLLGPLGGRVEASNLAPITQSNFSGLGSPTPITSGKPNAITHYGSLTPVASTIPDAHPASRGYLGQNYDRTTDAIQKRVMEGGSLPGPACGKPHSHQRLSS